MNIQTREELEMLRVVIGDNTPTTHPILGTIPVKGCFPLPITQTGTIITDNSGGAPALAGKLVVGTGTKFITGTVDEVVEQGDFLANADGVCRRIRFVLSDTQLELTSKFPASLSGAAVKLVKKNYYRSIVVGSTGTAAAILQEQAFEENDHTFDDGAPVSYDVSTTDCELSFTLSV